MQRSIKFILPGQPIPWSRATPMAKGRVWDSQKHQKLIISLAMEKLMGSQPLLEGPLEVIIYCYFPIPMKHQKNPQIHNSHYFKKPDDDNCAKILRDCANGILYSDDSLISDGHQYKRYDDGNGVRTEMTITEVK